MRGTLSAGAQVSIGPLIWVALAEMFPLAVRGPALAAANTGGLVSTLLVHALLPPLTKTVGACGPPLTLTGAWTSPPSSAVRPPLLLPRTPQLV